MKSIWAFKREADGSGSMFHWRDAAQPEQTGTDDWSIFPQDTKYFGNRVFAIHDEFQGR